MQAAIRRQTAARLVGRVAALALFVSMCWAVVPVALGIAPVAAGAAGASTLIVVNEGIGGVDIGQTAQQVKKEVGTPTSKQSSSSAAEWYYDNKPPFAEVSFGNNKRVSFLAPNSARDKTSKGIGEGSSKAQVQAAYPNASCSPQPGPGGKTDLSCGITKHLPGGKTIETSFVFSTANGSGGVNEVYISEF